MLRSAASKAMWIGRMTSAVVGLAVILALVLGVASMAMSATRQPFILGKQNTADQVTKLIRHGAGAALSLEVHDGQPPMKVNSSGKVANLNSDLLDGKSDTDFYAAGSKVDDSLHADSADSATNATNAQNADNATTADNADLLDNKDSSDFQPSYERTVVVSPVGTDTENGTALLAALSSITDASATNAYLLSIEPGTYDLGTGSLQMKEYVDIQGSGELNTLITTTVTPEECIQFATLYGADNAELRFLTVRAGACSTAIYNNSASPRLTHVTASASGAGNYYGVYKRGSSSPTMTNVTATGSDYGVTSYNASSPTIKQSTLSGSTYSLEHEDGTAKVADTQLVGPVANVNGTLHCFGNYDENLAAVTCP